MGQSTTKVKDVSVSDSPRQPHRYILSPVSTYQTTEAAWKETKGSYNHVMNRLLTVCKEPRRRVDICLQLRLMQDSSRVDSHSLSVFERTPQYERASTNIEIEYLLNHLNEVLQEALLKGWIVKQ